MSDNSQAIEQGCQELFSALHGGLLRLGGLQGMLQPGDVFYGHTQRLSASLAVARQQCKYTGNFRDLV